MVFQSFPGASGLARCVLIAGVVCVALTVRAGEPDGALTLAAAVQRATARAPLLEARQAQVAAAEEESRRAGALPDPMLSVGIENLPVTGADAFDTSADFMTMKKIGLQQDIPAGAKRGAERALARRAIEASRARGDADAAAVRRSTADAWIDVWSRERTLVVLHRMREQAAVASRVAQARVRGGGGSAVDAMAADAARLDLEDQIAEQEALRDTAAAELDRWVGADARVAQNAPDFERLPYTEAGLLGRVDRLPVLAPASADVEMAAAQIDLARAARRPDWNVTASYGQRSDGRDDMLTLEVGIGLPLFTRNRQDRGVAAREADYQAAIATREDLRREQIAQLRGAFSQWQGVRRQVALHEEQLLPLARDRSSAALAAFRAGGDLTPWLVARSDELNTELSHAEHARALGHAWAALAFLLPTEDQP